MSLQLAAQHLQKHGRNGDSMLVHMSPKEVKSLSDLAMAHGGQLTINPHTGLPEAGFLSSILPMVAGFALGPAGFGLSQMEAGIASGALGMVLNPQGGLMGGLMAGLGAYGGAGLGDALAKSGMEQATQAELAKNEAFQQAQQAAVPQAADLGKLAQQQIAAGNFNPEQFASQAQAITSPLNQMSGATAERIANEAGFGAPGLTTSTMGNRIGTAMEGIKGLGTESGRDIFMNQIGGLSGLAKTGGAAVAPVIAEAMKPDETPTQVEDKDLGPRYVYNPGRVNPNPTPDPYGREQRYFAPSYSQVSADQAKSIYGFAGGGPIEAMSNANAVGANTGYPMADINKAAYATPWQTPVSTNVVQGASDTGVNPVTGEMTNFASGGLSDAHYNLGGYSDGGRLLRGPGDGVSDSIPATIGNKQPARLADGEFVVPARIVSELGNGSTEAGARKLYAMMDRIQKARSSTVGKGKVAKNSKAEQYLPA